MIRDCETGDYASRPIDVRAYEKATKELAEMSDHLIRTARPNTFDAFNGDVSLVAIAFILMLLIGALMYWKCGGRKGDSEEMLPLFEDHATCTRMRDGTTFESAWDVA